MRPIQTVHIAAYPILWSLIVYWNAFTSGPSLAGFEMLPITILLIGYGFLGALTSTIALHVLKTHSGRRGMHFAWDIAEKGTLILAIIAGFVHATTFAYPPLLLAGAAFAATGILYLGRTLWQGLVATRERDAMDTLRGVTAAKLLHYGAAFYAAAAGISALRIGIFAPATVHLFFAGFLLATVYAVLNRVLPRFSTRPLPHIGHWTTVIGGLLGPALIVSGLTRGNDTLIFAGAILETLAVAAILFLAVSAYQTRRNPQPFAPFLAAALLLLLWGMTLGAHIATGVSAYDLIPVHAVNNLVGAFGLLVLGMGSLMLGTGQIRTKGGMVDIALPLGFTWVIAIISWEIAAAWLHGARPIADFLLASIVLIHGGLMLHTAWPRFTPLSLPLGLVAKNGRSGSP